MGKEDMLFGADLMIGFYGLTEQSMRAFCTIAERMKMTPEEIERHLKLRAEKLIRDYVSQRRQPIRMGTGMDN